MAYYYTKYDTAIGLMINMKWSTHVASLSIRTTAEKFWCADHSVLERLPEVIQMMLQCTFHAGIDGSYLWFRKLVNFILLQLTKLVIHYSHTCLWLRLRMSRTPSPVLLVSPSHHRHTNAPPSPRHLQT